MSRLLEDVALSIKKVQARHHRNLDVRLGHLGISLVQWNALREINRNPGKSAHVLAELTFNSDQAFGTLATRLVRLGFVTRKPGKGRAIIHILTGRGTEMLNAGQEVLQAFLKLSFAPLTIKERETLLALLSKMLRQELTTLGREGPTGGRSG